ncbi:MAG TPA: class I SAM-dependent methyltransferase [Anaeromyxobacter sp.]
MSAPHWTDAYYGALYLDSVADLLTPRLSAIEAGIVETLLALRPGGRVLDVACGHGRHALPLAARGCAVVGLDRSRDYLARAAAAARAEPLSGGAATWVRGDLRSLPFPDGAFDAAFSWYSSLFVFDDATNERCLAEAARVVRRGGRVLVQHGNPLQLAVEPEASAARTLPDGSRVEERSSWDMAQGVDRCHRRLVRPDGAVLAATAELRYYSRSEWEGLAARTGLRLAALTSTPGAAGGSLSGPGPEAPDVVALLEKST